MRLSPALFLLLAGLVSGCAEEPFVDTGTVVTVQKAPNPVLRGGTFDICHGDRTPWSDVIALAEEHCATHGLRSVLGHTQRWQCRATNPHRSDFRCVDPSMRNSDGSYVNPFSRREVAAWEKRTGKKAPAYGVARGPVVSPPAPDSPPAMEGAPPPPAPAPVTAVPGLRPGDIAGKPAMPETLPLQYETPPPPPPLPADGEFKLPVGSWSDSFQD